MITLPSSPTVADRLQRALAFTTIIAVLANTAADEDDANFPASELVPLIQDLALEVKGDVFWLELRLSPAARKGLALDDDQTEEQSRRGTR
ncbi:MAG: hypothetical protein AB7L71_07725 [Vicinamibacterales bacterium]